MNNRSSLSFFDEIEELKAIPVVVMDLVAILNNPDTHVDQIAEKIEKDTAMTAFVLKQCNSANYKVEKLIHSVKHGLIMLGEFKYKSTLMAYFLRHLYDKVNKKYISDYLWEHSVCVALIAKELGQLFKMKKDEIEEVYIAGLLHDLGKLALYFHAPEPYEELMHKADRERVSVCLFESDTYGFSHSDVGHHLMKKWNLPPMYFNSSFYHHDLSNFQSKNMVVKLATFANSIAHREIGKRKESLELFLNSLNISSDQYKKLLDGIFSILKRDTGAFLR